MHATSVDAILNAIHEAGFRIQLGASPRHDGTRLFCAVAIDDNAEEFTSMADSPLDAAAGLAELVGIDLGAR